MNLSKSKIIAFRQCPKRLWLEVHRKELRDDTGSEAVFQTGYQVGEIARKIYDPEGRGVVIDIDELGHPGALALSAELLAKGDRPIFEAGVAANGALAYADVMLPVLTDGAVSWRMIEVKSSASVKDYHHDDIAVQAHIAAVSGVKLSSVSLAHIDTSFVYQGGGDYRGLLKENEMTTVTISRSNEVSGWIAAAQTIAESPNEPVHATGDHCSNPFPCGFAAYCNREKVWPEYPLGSLPRFGNSKKNLMETMGIDDLRHVPDEYLNANQARVKAHTQANTVFFNAAGAAADLAPYGFPAYFLDFETTQFAIPIWPGTRPYAQVPFQFSLHILTEDGALAHRSFLDLSGNDPTRSFAENLIDICGSQGPVFVYASFEKRILRETAERFPEYAERLLAISQRIVDLLPLAKARYYHPSQHGSWSLKAVLPAAIPELSYEKLDGIQDGGSAALAFIEAITANTLLTRKNEIKTQLTEYCKLDTLALVKLYHFFTDSKNPDHCYIPDLKDK